MMNSPRLSRTRGLLGFAFCLTVGQIASAQGGDACPFGSRAVKHEAGTFTTAITGSCRLRTQSTPNQGLTNGSSSITATFPTTTARISVIECEDATGNRIKGNFDYILEPFQNEVTGAYIDMTGHLLPLSFHESRHSSELIGDCTKRLEEVKRTEIFSVPEGTRNALMKYAKEQYDQAARRAYELAKANEIVQKLKDSSEEAKAAALQIAVPSK